MLKIWANEGENVYILTDQSQQTQDEFTEKVFAQLTEDQQETVTDFALEGVLVDEHDDVEGVVVVYMTLQQYVDELKQNC